MNEDTFAGIGNLRLINQHIRGERFKTVKEIVGHMGAMQAQDYRMAKWAVGVRLPGSTGEDIEAAIDSGEIIRTHVLRPTWHFVSSDDIYWMLKLTAPRIKTSMRSRQKQLELTDVLMIKSNKIIKKALINHRQLTREALIAELNAAGIATDNSRASHLLLRAELDGILCSGASKEGKPTYALLAGRVPETKHLNKDEALARLAQKYFTSHGPATLQDFVWWSGLSITDARYALEMVKSEFISEEIHSQIYWLDHSSPILKNREESVYLLPAFDEFIISYKDRSVVLPFENHKKAVSNNGIFRPVVVVNGQVTGIWRRILKKDRVIVGIGSFRPPDKRIKDLMEEQSMAFGQFINKKVEMAFHSK